MTDDLEVEVLPRPHLRDEQARLAAKARVHERCRQMANLAHEIAMDVKHWRLHPLPRAEEMYLAMTLDSIEAARRTPTKCPFPGPEPKIAAE